MDMIPSPIRAAAVDPKLATTETLYDAVEHYVDTLPDESYAVVYDEYARRTDPDYSAPWLIDDVSTDYVYVS